LVRDAQVTLLGEDLYEATTFAIEKARSSPRDFVNGMLHISPYADLDVAAGAATALIEAIEYVGDFDAVILPLGDDGLAAGIGACAHPEIFGRKFDSNHQTLEQLPVCLPTLPMHADGLTSTC
jgi:threonine dehydratase